MAKENEVAALRETVAGLRKERDDALETQLSLAAQVDALRKERDDALETLRRIEAKVNEAAARAAQVELKAAVPAPANDYRGVRRYRVGEGGAYRDGRLYREGDVITLVDTPPGRTWVELAQDAPQAAQQSEAHSPAPRAADLSL